MTYLPDNKYDNEIKKYIKDENFVKYLIYKYFEEQDVQKKEEEIKEKIKTIKDNTIDVFNYVVKKVNGK